MFNNRILKTSFLISISAHLLFFVLVKPEINTAGFSCINFPKIDFIAVSLGKISFGGNLPGLNKIDSTYDFFRSRIAALNVLPEIFELNGIQERQAQNYVDVEPGLEKIDFPLAEYNNSQITGSLARRVVVFRPSSPQIPAWFKEKIAGPLEIEIGVDSGGDVVFCHRVTSTGSYALDIIGADYVRNFKFMPHNESFQYGKIRVSF